MLLLWILQGSPEILLWINSSSSLAQFSLEGTNFFVVFPINNVLKGSIKLSKGVMFKLYTNSSLRNLFSPCYPMCSNLLLLSLVYRDFLEAFSLFVWRKALFEELGSTIILRNLFVISFTGQPNLTFNEVAIYFLKRKEERKIIRTGEGGGKALYTNNIMLSA